MSLVRGLTDREGGYRRRKVWRERTRGLESRKWGVVYRILRMLQLGRICCLIGLWRGVTKGVLMGHHRLTLLRYHIII